MSIFIFIMTIIFLLGTMRTIDNKKEKIKGLSSLIRKSYFGLVNSEEKFIGGLIRIAIWLIILEFILALLIEIKKHGGQNSFAQITLLILFVIMLCLFVRYFLFGLIMLICNKIAKLINSIKNSKISNRLLISFLIVIFYGFMIAIAKDSIIWLNLIVFSGLATSYGMNIYILLNIVMDPTCLFKDKNKRYSLEIEVSDTEKIKITLLVSIFLIAIIIINLFLGVLITWYSYEGAYYCSIPDHQINSFDLFYYTMISFTTIGYGDIVPIGLGSQFIAIIISVTSVISLGIFIGAALSVKDKLKDRCGEELNNVSKENFTEDIEVIDLKKIQKEITKIADLLKNSESKNKDDREIFKCRYLKLLEYDLNTVLEGIDIRQLFNNKEFINDLKIRANKLQEKNLRLNTENLRNVELINIFKNSVTKLEVVREMNLISEKISNIANEADLLSINSRIEATKVGEYGNIFSIVANEINKLSNNSKKISNEIQEVATYTTLSINNIEKNADIVIKRKENYNGYNEIFDEINKVGDDILICCELLDKYNKEYNNISGVIENLISIINEQD